MQQRLLQPRNNQHQVRRVNMDYEKNQRERDQKPKDTGARPNTAGYPRNRPSNEREMNRTNIPAKNQLPKTSLAKPGRNDYPIPSATRTRDMEAREARDGKPREQRFLEDMEA